MLEEDPSNLTIAAALTSEELLDREIKKLVLIDGDLKTLNTKFDVLTEAYNLINGRIIGCAKKMNNISEDVQLVKSITKVFKCINARTADPKVRLTNDASPEFENLIKKILRQEKYRNYAHNSLEIKIKKTIEQQKTLEKHLEIATKHLINEEKYLIHFQNWICVLTNRKLRVSDEVKKLENELNVTILIIGDVPVPIIWRLKMIFDYKQFVLDRKLMFLSDTTSTLNNTIEQCNNSESLIKKIKMNVATLKTQISETQLNLKKFSLEENNLRARAKKLELYLKICTEVRNKHHLGEKLKVAQQYFNIFKQTYDDTKHALNKYKDELFIQTLKIAVVKANIGNNLIKRDELEAQIAFEMSER